MKTALHLHYITVKKHTKYWKTPFSDFDLFECTKVESRPFEQRTGADLLQSWRIELLLLHFICKIKHIFCPVNFFISQWQADSPPRDSQMILGKRKRVSGIQLWELVIPGVVLTRNYCHRKRPFMSSNVSRFLFYWRTFLCNASFFSVQL